jgi:hypothetical protein
MKFQNICPNLMPLIKRGRGDRRGWDVIKPQYRLKNFTLFMATDYISDRLLIGHFPFLFINREPRRMDIASYCRQAKSKEQSPEAMINYTWVINLASRVL